ncbi:uncharacterized protein [Physcomitrium patens]|uniref:uncharacterized protein n=1 Tax=Physcomitrium patens TaxID=3218 RepID=UPI003CCE35BD
MDKAWPPRAHLCCQSFSISSCYCRESQLPQAPEFNLHIYIGQPNGTEPGPRRSSGHSLRSSSAAVSVHRDDALRPLILPTRLPTTDYQHCDLWNTLPAPSSVRPRQGESSIVQRTASAHKWNEAGSTAPDLGPSSVPADAALLVGVELHPLLALVATLAVLAGGLPAKVLGLGALVAAAAAVVHVAAHVLLAPVLPVAVAVGPAPLARVLALAAAALGAGVRAALALLAARAAVVQVLAHVLLAPVLPVAVAVGPSRLAAVLAPAAVALGDGIGAALALLAAAAAVEHVLADVLLTPILPVVVAVSPAGLARELTPAFVALGDGVRAARTLVAAVAAVLHIVQDVGLAPVLVVVVAVLGAFFAPRVGRACMDMAEQIQHVIASACHERVQTTQACGMVFGSDRYSTCNAGMHPLRRTLRSLGPNGWALVPTQKNHAVSSCSAGQCWARGVGASPMKIIARVAATKRPACLDCREIAIFVTSWIVCSSAPMLASTHWLRTQWRQDRTGGGGGARFDDCSARCRWLCSEPGLGHLRMA